jgi:hypothetical protein
VKWNYRKREDNISEYLFRRIVMEIRLIREELSKKKFEGKAPVIIEKVQTQRTLAETYRKYNEKRGWNKYFNLKKVCNRLKFTRGKGKMKEKNGRSYEDSTQNMKKSVGAELISHQVKKKQMENRARFQY